MFIENSNNSKLKSHSKQKRTTLQKLKKISNPRPLEKLINNISLQQFLFQLTCLGILTILYKNNIHIISYLQKHNYNKNTLTNELKLSNTIIYYKAVLFSFFIITGIINYITFTKSLYNLDALKRLLLFLSVELIFILVIFYYTDKQILNLETFTNTNLPPPQNINYPNIQSNPDLPHIANKNTNIWKQMTDYKSTELPSYVKDPNSQYNKPEHYDYTPDDIPQWHLDEELSKSFKELKDKWENDPNRKYREQIKANDNLAVPYMEGGLDMIYPDTEVKDLWNMKREQNLPNSIILNALEGQGYDGKYVHNTEHLRRYDNCKLKALQHHNPSKLYFDPNIKYLHLNKWPHPKFKLDIAKCKVKNEFIDELELIKRKQPKLDVLSKYLDDVIMMDKNKVNEYSYKCDEMNTQYLNSLSGFKKNNSKSKNLNQYCTNFKPPNKEQLRKVNDNLAYGIYENK